MKISVAGTGYVGMSIATLLAQHSEVVAVDVIPEKVEAINAAAVGIKGGIELGYRFSPFFSVSLDAAYGTVPTKAMSCCNYWLREGERYSNTAAPASNAWHYYDLTSKASLLQVVLQILWKRNLT